MRYVSVCAGIEAATVAWHHLGWEPAWFSEIEPFPSAVLAHHYPKVKNLGDMTRFETWPDATVELICAGTPCQSFSVAGLRQGLADPRGNLMLTFLAIVQRYRPRWIVWENVPGVLSSNGGRDFGTFLGALGELGYGWAYRVLDAQWFGVAQRRRRVFVVGCLGDWQRPAQVLFERESVRRDSAPSREKGQETAQCLTTGVGKRYDAESETLPVTFAKTHKPMSATDAEGWSQIEAAPTVSHWPRDRSDTGTDVAVVQPITFGAQMSVPQTDVDMVQTLQAKNPMAVMQPMAFQQNTRNEVRYFNGDGQIVGALAAEAGMKQTNYIAQPVAFPIDTQNMTENHASGGLGFGQETDPSFTLTKGHSHAVAVAQPMAFSDVGATLKGGSGERGYPDPSDGNGHNLVAQRITGSHWDSSTNPHPTLNQSAKGSGGIAASDQELFSQRGSGLVAQPVAFEPGSIARNAGPAGESDLAPTLRREMGDNQPAVRIAMQVRRLTPVECERLQGFPDNYTNIPWRKKDESPDGPRYKALGNSMAVPVMRWIGERIAKVDA